MYSYPQQEKIFKDLINNNPSNKQCADCNTVGPTWASLNFGVFLCSDCSGAHRALGPTITRVKSTKLDQWQKDWMQNMQIGNKQLNLYWEGELGMAKKPRTGATQPQLIKYANQKYVRRRFVKAKEQQDPLTQYKKGTYIKNVKQQTEKPQPKPVVQNGPKIVPKILKPAQVKSNVAVQNESKNLNLIEFQFPDQPKLQVQSQTSDIKGNGVHLHTQNLCNPNHQKSVYNTPSSRNDDDDEFSEYTEHGTSFTGTTTQKSVTYDQLFAKKSGDSSDLGLIVPPGLHHTQSASSIPHNQFNSPHYNINMNGHHHHVGGNHLHYGNQLNLNNMYTQPQPQPHPHNPYQSAGYLSTQQFYSHNNNSMNGGFAQVNQFNTNQNIGINQNINLNTNVTLGSSNQNNSSGFGFHNSLSMSNQSNQGNQNPQHQSLGGYHNQGYGSHSTQSNQAASNQPQGEMHWNDFSGIMKPQYQSTQPSNQGAQNQNQNQNQNETKSWLDDWK